MKRAIKLILKILVVVFVIIQFFRPAENSSALLSNNDISHTFNISPDIQKIFQNSCFDCHSNNTRYPWYWQIQPVTWWMNSHIKDARRSVDFSEFLSYPARKQYKKIEDINEEVKQGDMPLFSYTIIHRSARLSDDQKLLVANWTAGALDQLKATYPPDSLRKR
jgi:Haem-binding domain